MWVRVLLCIAIVVGICGAEDLRSEDLRSVEAAFRKQDPSLVSFEARRKKPVDGDRSVMIVRAAPGGRANPAKSMVGVFVVSGLSNQVQLVLDVFPEDETAGFPDIGQSEANAVNLHFYSDYGIYQGSVKYFYNLSSGKPPLKFHYGMLALVSSKVRNGSLIYRGSSLGKGSEITIEPRPGDALPDYKITAAPDPEPQAVREAPPIQLPDGRIVRIMNTPVGQAHRAAGISVAGTFYPLPVPTMALDREFRPDDQAPGEIENNIGPFVLDGNTIWFANNFYDGEGTSGVGAIGSFDLQSHKFEMRYLPEIVRWSGSAMRLDGDDLWIGLMRQPEGAAFSGGLLRYDRTTESVVTYAIPDYIYTIDRLGDTIYCGTSNGLYTLRGDEITHLRFEPDATGKVRIFPPL